MKKHNAFKVLAVLLVFTLFVSIMPTSVFAASDTKVPADRNITFEDFMAGNATAADVHGPLDKMTVPDIIGYETAVIRNHVSRLYEDEGTDLNKVVFQNVDGSKTLYIFDFPVKYIDEQGKIKDIQLEVAESAVKSGEFRTASSNTVATFSANLKDGIFLRGNNVELKLVPVFESTNTMISTASKDKEVSIAKEALAKKINEKTVEYQYDNKTTIEYSPTYAGFKEDIVVSEYTGQTVYPFRLYTGGLTLQEIDGSYYLVDSKKNIKATIGDIIIFTADERNNSFGEIIPTTIVENEEYLLEIVVDADYLKDPKTTYPIRIDPTIEIDYNDGTSAIEDITITTNTNYTGSHTSLYVGRRTTEGVARALMRFPGLNLAGFSGYTITSANVMLRDLMCEGTNLDIYCHPFTGNVWDANSATWNSANANGYSSFYSDMRTITWATGNSYNPIHYYTFDITDTVQGWVDGTFAQNKGIIFKANNQVEAGDTINNRTFASFNRAEYKPYLTVTYTTPGSQYLANGTYYLNNKDSGQYVRYSSEDAIGASGYLSSLGNNIQWQIEMYGNGYVIRSKADNTKYLATAFDANSDSVEIVTVYQSVVPDRCYWDVTTAYGGGCLIRSKYNSKYLVALGSSIMVSSTLGSYDGAIYDRRVWRIASNTYYGNTSSHTMRELTAGTSFNNIEIAVGQMKDIYIQRQYSNEMWANIEDFTYTLSESGVASLSDGGVYAGSIPGGVKVTATHKVTGSTREFYVVVGFSSTILSTPLPASIPAELNEPYGVWPAGPESVFYYHSTEARVNGLTAIYGEAILGATATTLINLYPDAAALLYHYLSNTGTKYTIEFKEMIAEWALAENQRTQQMNQLMQAIEASATYSTKTLRTIEAYSNNLEQTNNWGLGVGKYYTSITCTYKKTTANTYTMTVVYELHDCYNYSQTSEESIVGFLSSQMWELHYGGYARNFEVYGINTFTFNWTEGASFNGDYVTNES